MQAAVEDALTIKIDGLTSLTRQIGKDVQMNTAAIEALTEATKIAANSMASMAEAFRELTERITAEPEEGDKLGKLLQDIYHICTLIYARLPAPAKR